MLKLPRRDRCATFLLRSNLNVLIEVYLIFRSLQLDVAFKVGLSPSEKICVVCFIESPLKMMKNAFYLILKAVLVLKIFKFLS